MTVIVEPADILDHYFEPGQITTVTGRVVRPWFMKPDDFCLEDIGPPLSKLCRYAGQLPSFYSVAEHCCHVLYMAKIWKHADHILRACFMHDASEAYLVDIPSPVKKLLPMKPYRDAEDRLEVALGERYDFDLFDPETAEVVKRYDIKAYEYETQLVRTGLTRGCLPDAALTLWREAAATLGLCDD